MYIFADDIYKSNISTFIVESESRFNLLRSLTVKSKLDIQSMCDIIVLAND